MEILERHGYSPEGYFYLPSGCWVDNYYRPIRKGLDAFLDRNGKSAMAKEIVEGEKAEMALYDQFQDYYSYGMYMAKKI
jgi:hypothetical protein